MGRTRFGYLRCPGCVGIVSALVVICALVEPQSKAGAGAPKRRPLIELMEAEPARAVFAGSYDEGTWSSSGGAKRPATVADSIAMTRVAGSAESRWYYTGASSSDFARFSPDAKRFIIVTKRGNLRQNTNEYSMLLFQTKEAFGAPTPKILVSFASSSEREAIKNVAWLDDDDTILFLGERTGGTTQVYSVRCSSGKVLELTHETANVIAYSASAKGKRLAFVTEPPEKNLISTKALQGGIVVSDEALSSLIVGRQQVCCEQLYLTDTGNSRPKPLHVRGKLLKDPLDLFLSPDGRYVALRTYVPKATDLPKDWGTYTDPSLHELLKSKESGGRPATFVERYELIDTQTDVSKFLLNSPVSALTQSELTWSSNSHSAIATGVYLPLGTSDPGELAARRSGMFTVEVRVPSLEITKIADHDLKLIGWDRTKQVLRFRSSRDENLSESAAQVLCFRKRGSRWEMLTGAELKSDSTPDISVDQDLNQPPRIVAVDPPTGRRSFLWDPNPQFHEIAFGHVEEVTWTGGGGREVHGGLYFPPDYIAGKRYPLVIQTHGFDPHGFWIDGPFTTAFAAQSLAGKGIIVLQVPDSHDAELTPEEAPRMVKTFETAIDYLDGRGLIDPVRVGIIGFSRTCLYVKYMLVHSNYKIAAASVADGVDGGYFQYIAMGDSLADESDQLYGVPPFGGGLAVWMKSSPGFRLDRVTAALRIQAMGPGSLLGEWEWFEGLTRLQRPAELVYMPVGTHILEKPRDRMVSQQGDVDWFAFWLKDEEDPDPSKAEQYVRWRKLRTLLPQG